MKTTTEKKNWGRGREEEANHAAFHAIRRRYLIYPSTGTAGRGTSEPGCQKGRQIQKMHHTAQPEADTAANQPSDMPSLEDLRQQARRAR